MPRDKRGRRGRLPKSMLSYRTERILEYLAKIALKYGSRNLFGVVVRAWNQGKAQCEKLSIWCRERKKESAIFLFTAGHDVVAQFPIPTALLQGDTQLELHMKEIAVRNPRVTNPRIKDLKAGMRQIDLKAKVLQTPTPSRVLTKFGTIVNLSNVLIGDETGTITMTLWNQQIQMVAKGDLINIENGRVVTFRGERQLRIGKVGSLSVIHQDAMGSLG